MKNTYLLAPILIMLAFTSIAGSRAEAFTLSGFGGTYFGSNEGGLWGGEATFGLLPTLDFGFVYERSHRSFTSFYSDGTPFASGDNRDFYGAVGRWRIPDTHLFADTYVGYHSDKDDSGFGLTGFIMQVGAGYSLKIISLLSLEPRLGFIFIGTNETYPSFNGRVLLTLNL